MAGGWVERYAPIRYHTALDKTTKASSHKVTVKDEEFNVENRK